MLERGRDESCRTHVRDIGGWCRRGAGQYRPARGRPTITPIAFASVPYPRTLQQRVVDLSLHGHVAEICHMNMYLGELFAKAALKVIRAAKYQPADIHVIGSHGQTIHHLPKEGASPAWA